MNLRFYLMRDGVMREDMELQALRPPEISMDSAKEIKGRLRGSFRPLESANLMQDHIVSVLDGQNCGEFVVSRCKTVWDGASSRWEIEACDQTLLLARNRQEKSRFFRAGSEYMPIIQQLLLDCGIFRILADSCEEVLQTDRRWELGTRTLDMVNELLSEIGFEELWFDGDGYARLQRYRPPLADNVQHIYRGGDYHLESECSAEWDVFSAKNVFVAVADSPEREVTWTATAVNDDPASPISTVQLGRIMAPVMVVENVASQAALQTFAERIRDENMLSAQVVTFYTDMAVHQMNELIALEHPQLEGIYKETGWIMDFAARRMIHQGRRVYFL